MILVDDHEGPALLDPENPEVLAALDEARAHYEGSDSSAQPPCHAELYGDTQVVTALAELVNRNLLEFHGSRPIRYSLTATARAEFLQ